MLNRIELEFYNSRTHSANKASGDQFLAKLTMVFSNRRGRVFKISRVCLGNGYRVSNAGLAGNLWLIIVIAHFPISAIEDNPSCGDHCPRVLRMGNEPCQLFDDSRGVALNPSLKRGGSFVWRANFSATCLRRSPGPGHLLKIVACSEGTVQLVRLTQLLMS